MPLADLPRWTVAKKLDQPVARWAQGNVVQYPQYMKAVDWDVRAGPHKHHAGLCLTQRVPR